ncbi:MAG: CPBP family intramembrane metalloprotease [Candidatus Omnitrophica bacterium]|nr:CPBP family intramembrane metalloprotease [Candidatus Omnitrophota bacterium]
MSSKLNIRKIRAFLNQERIYFLMLSFILLVNASSIATQHLSASLESKQETSYPSFVDKEIKLRQLVEGRKYLFVFLNLLGLGALFLFSFGIFLDIRILMAKIKKKKLFLAPLRHPRVKWRVWDIFRLSIIALFLGYVMHLVQTGFFPSTPDAKKNLPASTLLNTGILDLTLLGLVIYFVTKKYKQGLASLGLKIKNIGKNIVLGCLSYVAFLPVLAFLFLMIIWIASYFNYQPPVQNLFKLFLEEKRIWLLIYSTLMVVLLGPVVEEVFFRGFAYNALKRSLGAKAAIVLTAVIFSALHANVFGFLPIAALGFLLAYVYEKSGSLIPAITIHIVHNSVMLAMLFLVRYLINLE